MMNNIWLLLIAMGAVTYIPRMVPMIFLQDIKLPPFLRRVLEFIPIAALSALIFPGIIYSTDSINSAITGGVIAVILAWLEVDLLVVVGGGIGGVLLVELLL